MLLAFGFGFWVHNNVLALALGMVTLPLGRHLQLLALFPTFCSWVGNVRLAFHSIFIPRDCQQFLFSIIFALGLAIMGLVSTVHICTIPGTATYNLCS